jgi:putative FmdB family regulatory protein
MPTYEYVCKSCGHLFEIVQSMRDEPLTECPECSGELRKVFAPPAIAFRGSGFYATDSRRATSKAEGKDASTDRTSKGKDEGAAPGGAGTKEEGAGSSRTSASRDGSSGASSPPGSPPSKEGSGA